MTGAHNVVENSSMRTLILSLVAIDWPPRFGGPEGPQPQREISLPLKAKRSSSTRPTSMSGCEPRDVAEIKPKSSSISAALVRAKAQGWIENHTPVIHRHRRPAANHRQSRPSPDFSVSGGSRPALGSVFWFQAGSSPISRPPRAVSRFVGIFPKRAPFNFDRWPVTWAWSVPPHPSESTAPTEMPTSRSSGRSSPSTPAPRRATCGSWVALERRAVSTASGKIWLENLSGSSKSAPPQVRSTSRGIVSTPTTHSNPIVFGPRSTGRSRGRAPAGTLTTTTGNIRSELPGEVVGDGSTLRLSGDGPVFDVETASAEIVLSFPKFGSNEANLFCDIAFLRIGRGGRQNKGPNNEKEHHSRVVCWSGQRRYRGRGGHPHPHPLARRRVGHPTGPRQRYRRRGDPRKSEASEITIEVVLTPRRGGFFSSKARAEQEVESAS